MKERAAIGWVTVVQSCICTKCPLGCTVTLLYLTSALSVEASFQAIQKLLNNKRLLQMPVLVLQFRKIL